MKTKILAVVIIASTLGLAGCAANPYGNAYNVNDARQMQQVYYGTVMRTQAVTLNGNGNGIGTLAGGAIGGILGSGVGGGTGSEIAAIGGALLGGYLGNAAGNQVTKHNGVNLTIKMDSGRTVSIVQQVNPQVIFHIGERVQVNLSDNGTSRVTPA
ncbi:glycine zipper 2TM domain-containing protein [Photobacterium carnosum]|uniref:glycine zipper 2TM domain-containing protein n=1 Tax=Photobacterium carnosum TaxID=2023717 RepID=UPI001E4F7C60|nr:glycine zipper 2TM domain-containing protein [Photobacterium carnosum]MCD9548394.1 glycine zipper 2TM domain-containing protein [Photobacterium carnosum]MCF2306358.1 glycine zipper 2TM domain-containing protein [Photobacterium carnosum]